MPRGTFIVPVILKPSEKYSIKTCLWASLVKTTRVLLMPSPPYLRARNGVIASAFASSGKGLRVGVGVKVARTIVVVGVGVDSTVAVSVVVVVTRRVAVIVVVVVTASVGAGVPLRMTVGVSVEAKSGDAAAKSRRLKSASIKLNAMVTAFFTSVIITKSGGIARGWGI